MGQWARKKELGPASGYDLEAGSTIWENEPQFTLAGYSSPPFHSPLPSKGVRKVTVPPNVKITIPSNISPPHDSLRILRKRATYLKMQVLFHPWK